MNAPFPDPEGGGILLERLLEKVSKGDPVRGCWTWTGTINAYGYGRIHNVKGYTYGPKIWQAHRLSFELHIGPIPVGLQLDHLCRNRACVHPDHLQPVTLAENIARGETGKVGREKTHCPKGHPYSGENLFFNNKGDRLCRECSRIWGRRYHALKQKAAMQ